MTFETTRLHTTWCQEVRILKNSQYSDRNMNWGQHQRSDSEPGVDTVGIYVENHVGRNRECFIWIRFDNRKLCEKGSLPHLRKDPLISETCPLEESASHHLFPGGESVAPHEKSTRNLQKSMILKMNQDTYGDFLRYQQLLGMTFDTTRLHETWFQAFRIFTIFIFREKWWPGHTTTLLSKRNASI